MSLFAPKIPLKTAEQFCSRLATGLKAGVDPLKMLEAEARVGTQRHQAAVADVRTSLLKGDSFAEALERRSDYFPSLLAQMVRAGEHAGGLEKTFAYMGSYYRDLRETRTGFLRQLTWPAIQVTLAIGVVSLMIWIMGVLFTDSSQANYDPLGFGLKGTSGVAVFLSYVGAVVLLIAVVVRAVWKNWFGLHEILMPIALKVPVIGPVLKNIALSRLTTILSLLLNAGVDAIRSVQTSFVSTGNQYYVKASPKSIAAVKKGKSLSDSFLASGVLPREFIEAVEVGELSGNETESLDALARQYDAQTKTSLQILSVTVSMAIWIVMALLLVFLILRLAMSYVNMLQDVSNGNF